MKLYVLIIFAIVTLDINGFSQCRLILKNKVNGLEKDIFPGREIKVVIKDGSIFHGKFAVICDSILVTDSFIVVGTNKVRLDEIKKIKILPQRSLIGGSLVSCSGIIMILDGLLMLSDKSLDMDGLIVEFSGAIATYVGVNVTTSSIGRTYKFNKWDYFTLNE